MTRELLVGDMGDESLSIHTVDGAIVGDIPANAVSGLTWGRELSEVSIADFSINTDAARETLEDIRPWLHWVTVWDHGIGVWTGPIQKAIIGRESSSISARDCSTFAWRSRCPITRTWTETATTDIAAELYRLMLAQHRIRTTPLVIPTLADDTFTIRVDADSRMVHQVIEDLVKLGMDWTIVGGRPVLGTFPTTPVAELTELDFLVEIQRIRDGSQTFNDIRVQGQNWGQTAIVELSGLNLQGIVALDDMFGVSNIQKAARRYVSGSAAIRDTLLVPNGAALHPDAPVSIDDLTPGRVFTVHSDGVSNLMRLDSMSVAASDTDFTVQVSLVAVPPDLGELAKLVTGGQTL